MPTAVHSLVGSTCRKELEGRETEYIQHFQPRFNGQKRPQRAAGAAEISAEREQENEKHFIDELLQEIAPAVQLARAQIRAYILHVHSSLYYNCKQANKHITNDRVKV